MSTIKYFRQKLKCLKSRESETRVSSLALLLDANVQRQYRWRHKGSGENASSDVSRVTAPPSVLCLSHYNIILAVGTKGFKLTVCSDLAAITSFVRSRCCVANRSPSLQKHLFYLVFFSFLFVVSRYNANY